MYHLKINEIIFQRIWRFKKAWKVDTMLREIIKRSINYQISGEFLLNTIPQHDYICISFYETLRSNMWYYRQICNTRRALIGNAIVDHSNVVGASPAGAAPTTSSFSI